MYGVATPTLCISNKNICVRFSRGWFSCMLIYVENCTHHIVHHIVNKKHKPTNPSSSSFTQSHLAICVQFLNGSVY